jgi:hypothetical protein
MILHRLTLLTDRLKDPPARRRVYLACATLLYLLALALMTAKALFSHKEPRFDFACSDGKYYYQYLPSVIIDHDLDFTNQLRDGWGSEPPYNAEMEHDRVKYPIGVSLSLVPSFVVAHIVSVPLHAITGRSFFAPNGYTVIYQLLNLGMVMLFVYGTMIVLDGLLTGAMRVEGRIACFAVVSVIMGTQYLYHTVRFPGMAHVFSVFWVSAMVLCVAMSLSRLKEGNAPRIELLAMVFCFSMALVCRPTNVVTVVFPIYVLFQILRLGHARKVVRELPGMLVMCFPVVLQLLFWKRIFGEWLPNTYSHGEFFEPFYWTWPKLWDILFSLKAGLFVWCPVWTLGFLGIAIAFKRVSTGKAILICYLLSFLLLWYINSAWWCWTLSNYPGRGFVELSGAVAIGLGLWLQHSARPRRVASLVGLAIVLTLCTSIAYDLKLVPRYADDLIESALTELRKVQ